MLYYISLIMAIYAGITLLAAILGNVSQISRFVARILVGYILMVFCALYGVVASIFLRAVGKVGIAQWTVARAFRWTLCPAIGVKFEMFMRRRLTEKQLFKE